MFTYFDCISDAYCLLAPVLSWSAASRSNSALHLGHDLGGQGLDEALLDIKHRQQTLLA